MPDTIEVTRRNALQAGATHGRWPHYWPYVLLFALIVAVLAGAEWHLIRAVNYETGDFAANSLLIQKAKHLHLIHGNYSRVGFNHPGPAILYVLAFGELVFHDWLHIVPSPFSGQIVAGILYNAAWLVLICALVRRMTVALAPALLFVAVLVLVAAFDDAAIITGLWFPHLYFFPYAAMLVAIAPLAYGRSDSLTPLAVASGFLINGHASFVPMLGVILIVVVGANTLIARRERAIRILSRAWFAQHRRRILVAGGILLLFFVPLMIATVRDYPGPVGDYLRFSHGNKGNSLRQALTFVAIYWGTGRGLVLGLALALVVALLLVTGAGDERAHFIRAARGLGIACAGATVAVLYYAKVGVDMLDQTYIALFYYSVPALCAALLALFLCQLVAPRWRSAVAGLLALAALGVVRHWVHTPPFYAHLYNRPGVVELVRQLQALPGSGRIVLDIEQNTDAWGELWSKVLSVQAYTARRHLDLICVNQGWHISNTHPARCRPEEVAANRRYEVHPDGPPDAVRGMPDVAALGVALYREGAPVKPAGYITVKEQPAYFTSILGRGWSHLEGEYVWSEAPRVELNLPADPARGRWLRLDFGSFAPANDVVLHVQASVDGKPAGATEYSGTDLRHRFAVDLGPDPGATKYVVLSIDGAVTPRQYNPLSGDTRQLGLSLYGIQKASND